MTTLKIEDIADIDTLTKNLVHLSQLVRNAQTADSLLCTNENMFITRTVFDIRKAGILALLAAIELHVNAPVAS